MSWTKESTVYGTLIRNKGGKDLGMAGTVPVLEQDGFAFKDLARTGELLPYEDWRLDPETRAADLAGRLSREEIAGLMLYSSHQMVPFTSQGPFSDTYGGEAFDPGKHDDADLTDGQIRFLKKDHIRHVLQMRAKNARVSAQWSNNLQQACEEEPWGIPVNISTDPRHGASAAGAVFCAAGAFPHPVSESASAAITIMITTVFFIVSSICMMRWELYPPYGKRASRERTF